MLDDAMFNVEDWLADEIAREFAVAEGTAFVGGNGTNRPKGFLYYAATDAGDAARDFGTLQYVASGAAGGFSAASPQAGLNEQVYSPRVADRPGAPWWVTSGQLGANRMFKTRTGDRLVST